MRSEASRPLLRFLESVLGPLAGGTVIANHPDVHVQIARFEDQPVPNAVTYVTTGLSRHSLHQASGRPIRLELLGCIWSAFRDAELDKILFSLAADILKTHHAPAQGDIVGPHGPITSGSRLEAFCFAQPLYHSESLSTFGAGEDEVHIAWALPVSATEAASIREFGWSSFEERVHAADPDLLDLNRRPIL